MERRIGAVRHSDANAVACIGCGSSNGLRLDIPILLLVILECHVFVVVN